MSAQPDFDAIAKDLELCGLGLALKTGATRRKYAKHRKACFAEIKRVNRDDGLDQLSDEELLAELSA